MLKNNDNSEIKKWKDIEYVVRREIRWKARFSYGALYHKVEENKLVIYFRDEEDRQRFMIYIMLNYPAEIYEQISLDVK